MKLTRHNGRAGKHGAYNPKHNDRSFDIENSEHIDAEKAKQNVYWDCYNGIRTGLAKSEDEELGTTFEEVERTFYEIHYQDHVDGQNERNLKNRHTERNRTTDDIRTHKKTCPEETVYQIGTMDDHIDPEVLLSIVTEFMAELHDRYGEHFHLLDWALHLDESTPHIHERHILDCENAYGEIFPQQEKALEVMGFELPDPSKKVGRYNNRKMVFDAECRDLLFNICKAHGLQLEEEPTYGGRGYLEKQDYILMKQKEQLTEQAEAISEQESRLDDLTVRIEDTEKFIDEVSEIAYETAVDVVTERVIEETHNADFDEIEKLKKSLTSEKSKIPPQQKSVIAQTLNTLMKRFRGLTEHITERLAAVFGDPVQKKAIQEPIRQSIRDRLISAQKEADAYNRQKEMEQPLGAAVRKKNNDLEM